MEIFLGESLSADGTSSIRAVLFDLGNTLVSYYDLPQFPDILNKCMRAAAECLVENGWNGDLRGVELNERVALENHESKDFRVRPLSGRLMRIFGLAETEDERLIAKACKSFMEPIFALGSIYDDVLSTLDALRQEGYQTAIVTNTPWGSPSSLWHEEMDRLGLASRVDIVVCCDDVGWRKPAEPIFQYTIDKLNVAANECIFVGDDPRWDIVGPQAIGIHAILIDRMAKNNHRDLTTINSLQQLRLILKGDSKPHIIP